MKKLIINGRFLTQAVTGVQRYARELVQAIDQILDERKDFEVHLLTPRLKAKLPPYRNIVSREVGSFQGHLWEQLELPRYVRDAILFCPGNSAPVASLLSGHRVAVTVHDLSYRYFPSAYSLAFRLLYNVMIPVVLRKADAVITVSKSEQASILKLYPFVGERLWAVQNGGAPEGCAPALKKRREIIPCILYVGSLSRRKNFPGMLEVAVRLVRKRPVRFVFVGGTPDGLTDSLIEVPVEARSHIEFLGQVNDWELLKVQYQGADCLFFPSFYEASPLPPVEAMACGCPVLSSSIPSLTERCGDAALYCDPDSVEDMCEKIEQLLDDDELHCNLQKKGYKRAALYRWRDCAEQTLDIILSRSAKTG